MRRSTLLAIVLGALVVVLVAGTLVVGRMMAADAPECTVPRADGSEALAMDAVQLQHASTINAVGLSRGLPERARVIAIATAMQESSLRNLDHGDRDSLGLFQQRPSQGWGSEDEVQDPVYAAGAFYDALLRVNGWKKLSLTEAAQKVQRSGYPEAYAKWEDDATALAVQLGGAVEPRLSCRSGAVASTRPAPERDAVSGEAGLSGDVISVLRAAHAELGEVTVSGGSDPEEGSVEVSATLPDVDASVAGRALAAWAVAHATSFGIEAVTVSGDAWTVHGWGPAGESLTAGVVRLGF